MSLTGMGNPAATNPLGSNGLSYNTKINQYTYTWVTDNTWKGMCRKFILKLNDGMQHVAYFKFTK